MDVSAKILRIANAYGIEKKWGHIASVAEKLGISAASVSLWKTNGVPDGVLARVARETEYTFEYLDTGNMATITSGRGTSMEGASNYGFDRESMREAIISIDMVEKSIGELIPSEIKAQLTLDLYDMYVRKEKVSSAKVIQLVREALAA